jgi:hypothetical protein
MRKVVEQMENIFEEILSQSTICQWVHKLARPTKEYAETHKSSLSGNVITMKQK